MMTVDVTSDDAAMHKWVYGNNLVLPLAYWNRDLINMVETMNNRQNTVYNILNAKNIQRLLTKTTIVLSS